MVHAEDKIVEEIYDGVRKLCNWLEAFSKIIPLNHCLGCLKLSKKFQMISETILNQPYNLAPYFTILAQLQTGLVI